MTQLVHFFLEWNRDSKKFGCLRNQSSRDGDGRVQQQGTTVSCGEARLRQFQGRAQSLLAL